jgi:hypothetical protein
MLTEQWEEWALLKYHSTLKVVNDWNDDMCMKAIMEGRRHAYIQGEDLLHYHAGHIVWCDGNYESYHIESCIEDITRFNEDYNYPLELLQILEDSLQSLLTLPKYEDCEDYTRF